MSSERSDTDSNSAGTPAPPTVENGNVDISISQGDFFPYCDEQGSLNYGRVTKVDPSRNSPYRVSLPECGHIWLSEHQYEEDAPEKHIFTDRTAADIFPHIDEHNGL